jgi:hypothetical protein
MQLLISKFSQANSQWTDQFERTVKKKQTNVK